MSVTVKHTDAIAAVLFLALAGGVFAISADFPTGPTETPGAAFFPRVIVSAIALLAVVLFVRDLRSDTDDAGYRLTRSAATDVLVPLAFVSAYVLTMPLLGFLVGTIVFLVSFMRYSGVSSLRTAVPGAVGFVLLLYYVFVGFLYVPLPESAILPISRLLPPLPLLVVSV